jgi:hypothetical protein
MKNLHEFGVSRLQEEELVSIEGGSKTPVQIVIDTWNKFNDLVVSIFF